LGKNGENKNVKYFTAYVDVIRLTDGISSYDDLYARLSGFGFEEANSKKILNIFFSLV